MTHDIFAQRLRDHIDESGLSLPTIGELADGLDQAYIWRMARGERPPASRNVVICLCLALRLTVHQTDELLTLASHLPVSSRRGARRPETLLTHAARV